MAPAVEKIDDKVTRHQEWLDTDGDEGECFMMNNTISKMDFSEMELSKARFRDCIVQDVSFEYAELNEALFDGCSFERVSFLGAILEDAIFKNCIFQETEFDDDVKEYAHFIKTKDAFYTKGDLR